MLYEHFTSVYRWLKLKGRNKEALAILSRINAPSEIDNSEKKALEAEMEKKSEIKDKIYLFKELFNYKFRYVHVKATTN